MVKLNKNLIDKIMLYVSHPCADVMRTCRCDNFDDVLVLKTKSKFIPSLDRFTMSFFSVRNNTSIADELSYECSVVESVIYNKLNVWCVTEDNILMLCPEYVHFNRNIINIILNKDEARLERYRRENDPYYDRDIRYDSTPEESDYSD